VTWAESFSNPNDEELGENRNTDEELDSELSEIESEFEADYHHWIATYSDFLSELFQVKAPEIESATIKTAEEADFLDDLFRRARFTPIEKRALRFQVENNLRTYIPGTEILYLASPTSNGAAELAAIHLYRHFNGSQSLFAGDPESFYRSVLESMFGFFGSLLVNPKRKCDLPGDHARRIIFLKGQKGAQAQIERDGRNLALRFLGIAADKSEKRNQLIRSWLRGSPQKRLSTVLAAHYIGRVLAKKLHQAVMLDHLSLAQIRSWVLKRSSSADDFHSLQIERMISAVAHQKIESSKQDRL
jgi:hypothetical protein